MMHLFVIWVAIGSISVIPDNGEDVLVSEQQSELSRHRIGVRVTERFEILGRISAVHT